jgi:hypothetical protein
MAAASGVAAVAAIRACVKINGKNALHRRFLLLLKVIFDKPSVGFLSAPLLRKLIGSAEDSRIGKVMEISAE